VFQKEWTDFEFIALLAILHAETTFNVRDMPNFYEPINFSQKIKNKINSG